MNLIIVVFLVTTSHLPTQASVITTAIDLTSVVTARNLSEIEGDTNRTMVTCSAGTYLTIDTQGDACHKCLPGHFMPQSSNRSIHCWPCNITDDFSGEVQKEPCTAVSDTVVNCIKDFYLMDNSCLPCHAIVANISNSSCVFACCFSDFNGTNSDVDKAGQDSGNNDWRIVFLVGLLGLTLFSLLICVWRGVFKNGHRGGKNGCFSYKRIRTQSNSL